MLTRKDFILLAAFGLVIFALLSPVLLTGHSFFLRDITYLFHPWRTLTAEILQRGDMPLWDPYAYCGMPLLADWQSSVFYPFSLLFYLFPFPAALKLFQTVHLFLAGAFVYLFARRLGLGRASAFGAMAVFALNGHMVTRLEFLSQLGASVWTFALLLCVCTPSLAAVVAAFSFFAGHQAVLLQAVVLAVYLAAALPARLYRLDPSRAAAALLLTAGLAACQLLPTLELARLSGRLRGGVDAAVAFSGSLAPSDLLRLVSPLFTSSLPAVAGERLQWNTSIHIGAAALVLSMAALAGLRRSSRRPLLAAGAFLAVLGLVLAMGSSTALYPFLYRHVPFFNAFRYPSQYALLSMAGFSLLAAEGIGRSRRGAALAVIVTAELFIASWMFQATAPDGYFYRRSATVETLQHTPENDRFILSPGTEKNRVVQGPDIATAWETARGQLYNLTCLPYHLRNAFGAGEPLTLASFDAIAEAAYAQKDAQSAAPYFRMMNSAFLLTRAPLPDEQGYVPYARTSLYLYRIVGPQPFARVLSGTACWSMTDPHTYRVMTEARSPSSCVLKEPLYPGWQTIIDGKRRLVTGDPDGFRRWSVPAGSVVSWHIYRPASFLWGVLLSAASLLLLAAAGLSLLRAARRPRP